MPDVTLVDLETNQPVTVGAEEAAAMYRSGRFSLPSSTSELQVVSPTGKVGTIDANRVADALKMGYGFATHSQRLAREAQDQPVRAFVEAGASELTMGLSDVVAERSGVKGLRERRDTGAGQAGKWTGFGAGILSGGGLAGAAVRAGETALAKTAAGAALRELTETAATKVVGETLQQRAAQAVVAEGLRRGARSGSEGFLYGAGAELSEQALGPDVDYNVERVLAGGGMGALLGAGLEGAVAGVRAGKALKGAKDAAARRAAFGQHSMVLDPTVATTAREAGAVTNLTADELRAVVERRTGEALTEEGAGFLKQLWGKMRSGANKVAGTIYGKDPAILDELSTKASLEVIREGRQGVEAIGRNFAAELNRVRAKSREAASLAFGSLRPELRTAAISEGHAPGMLHGTADVIDDLHKQLDEFVKTAPGMTERQAQQQVRWVREKLMKMEDEAFNQAGIPRKYSREVQREVAPGVMETVRERGKYSLRDLADLPGNSTAAARRLYDDLDQLKRFLDSKARFGDDISSAAQAEAAGAFKRMHASIKTGLEDDGVWGVLGTAQREVNEAAAARFTAMDELERVIKFDAKGNADSASVAAFMNSLKTMRGDRAIDALDAWADAESRFAAAAEKHLGGAFKSQSDEALRGLAGVRSDLQNKVRILNLVDEMNRTENTALGGGMMLAGALPGFIAAGPVGAVVGGVGAALLRPGRNLKMRAHLGVAMDRLGQAVQAKTARLAEGVKAAAPSEDTTLRTLARATTQMLQGSPKEREEAYFERVAQLDRLGDPYHFHSSAGHTLGPMEEAAPAHGTKAGLKASEAVQFLRSAYPMPSPGSGGLFDPLDPTLPRRAPTAADIERFAKLDVVIQDPTSILDNPRVTRAEVEAVERVYPGLTRQMRAALQDKLSARKAPLPAAARRQVATILGLPTFNAANLPKWQARFEPAQVAAPQGSSTPRTSKNPRSSSLMPTSDAVLRRETARR